MMGKKMIALGLALVFVLGAFMPAAGAVGNEVAEQQAEETSVKMEIPEAQWEEYEAGRKGNDRAAAVNPICMDIVFLLDTTGSMNIYGPKAEESIYSLFDYAASKNIIMPLCAQRLLNSETLPKLMKNILPLFIP